MFFMIGSPSEIASALDILRALGLSSNPARRCQSGERKQTVRFSGCALEPVPRVDRRRARPVRAKRRPRHERSAGLALAKSRLVQRKVDGLDTDLRVMHLDLAVRGGGD